MAGYRIPRTLALAAFLAISCAPANSASPPGKTHSEQVAVEEQSFVRIGGIEQWVTISGQDRSNPVILFIHGGPGNPLSPFSRSLYGGWTRDFTIVQWDQRGAGRTFGRNPSTANGKLGIEQMAADGIQVAEYLRRHLNRDRIILVGGSWGSALAVHMVKRRPDLFSFYVGVGQLVGNENQAASVARLSDLAAASGDTSTLDSIRALGPPPWSNPRNFGILRRLTRAYEARAVDAAPASWWVPEAGYATTSDEAAYEAGEDYSYLQFVGPTGDGLLAGLDLRRLGSKFDIPIILIQGAQDLVTTPDVARSWLDGIDAPRKQFVLVQRMGHDPNAASLKALFAALKASVAEDRHRAAP